MYREFTTIALTDTEELTSTEIDLRAVTTLRFAVRGDLEARMALITDDGSSEFQIILGHDSPDAVRVMGVNDLDETVEAKEDLLYNTEYRKFWLTWENGEVRFTTSLSQCEPL